MKRWIRASKDASNMSRDEALDYLYDQVSNVKNWNDARKLFSFCIDFNSSHDPNEEIFMSEIYEKDGYSGDGFAIEDDVFYLSED